MREEGQKAMVATKLQLSIEYTAFSQSTRVVKIPPEIVSLRLISEHKTQCTLRHGDQVRRLRYDENM